MPKSDTPLKKAIQSLVAPDKNAKRAISLPANRNQTRNKMLEVTTHYTNQQQMQQKSKQPLFIVSEIMRDFSDQTLKDFCKGLFPLNIGNEVQEGLDSSIRSFYKVKRNLDAKMEDIKKIIIQKALIIGEGFQKAIISLLDNQDYAMYLDRVTRPGEPDVIEMYESGSKDINKDKKDVASQPPRKSCIKPTRSPSDPKKLKPQMVKNLSSNEIDSVINLEGKGFCICDKPVLPNSDCFTCIHCKQKFHFSCMQRQPKLEHCLYCHLSRLIPTKPPKKTLYVGLLKKGIRKHEFTINLSEQQLSMRNKIQVRCFRIKQSAQNFVLFPDSFELQVNKNTVKIFEPLHKQSCLKYRKDEPFNIDYKYLIPRENNVVVSEKLASKDMKDMRIEAQTHLIGIYVIQQKKCNQLVSEIIQRNITTLEESKKILNGSFINSKGDDDVSCDIVKIPLECHLSKQRLRIPVRGIFCNHFLCFDLYSFVVITSKSPSLRWICPQCKQPCYQFKVDCILLAILEQYETYEVTEAMFFKTGAFSVSTKDGYIQDQNNQRINQHIDDLDITTISKRAATQLLQQGPMKKKVQNHNQPTDVIELD